MPKRNLPTYRLHKPSGRAVVTHNGKDYYLGRHGSKASREEYERILTDYLANGKKRPPTATQSGMIGEELAIHFLDWCEGYYRKNSLLTQTFGHNKTAVSLFVRHYGNKSVNDFTPLSLDFLQKEWIKHGYTRLTVNRYVCVIKQMFRHGTKFGWVDPQVHYALSAVDSLKAGRTKAPEYKDIMPVADEIVEKTLPFLPPVVADMVRVQRLAGMRPQEVRNMRSCDIDRNSDVWVYRPFTHKTQHHGKKLAKAIGPRAQAILLPYLIDKQDNPEAFLFSPEDTVRLQRIERRKNRKSFNKNGEVQPSQKDRSKLDAIKPTKQYSRYSYAQVIHRACTKAGVEAWSPNRLQHTAGTETTALFSLEAAKEFLGHSSITTTEKFYVAPLPELAANVAREIG